MDVFSSLKISASALEAQQIRLNTISSNLANIETTRTPEGGPYRKRDVVFKAERPDFAKELDGRMRDQVRTVRVSEIRPNSKPFTVVYDPSHPDANDKGMVEKPNINLMEETVDMMNASRAYDANVTAIKAAKRMALKALEIGR
jgi:flagellar basal-body rod protein FlgC